MRLPSFSYQTAFACIAATVLLAGCGAGRNSTLLPSAGPQAASGSLHTMGNSGGGPTPTPSPTPSPVTNPGAYCGGDDKGDCHAYKFVSPIFIDADDIAKGRLDLYLPAHHDEDCDGVHLSNRWAFSAKSDVSVPLHPSYLFKDICAPRVDDDGAHRMGSAPITIPGAQVTPSPSPAPAAGGYYIVSVAISCDAAAHQRGEDNDDHKDCDDISRKDTLIAAVAGPGVSDGNGHLSFASYAPQFEFKAHTKYFFFLAKLRDGNEPPYHI